MTRDNIIYKVREMVVEFTRIDFLKLRKIWI